MKNLIKISISVLIITTAISCHKDSPSHVYDGSVTFWNSNTNVGTITVNVTGQGINQTSKITYSYTATSCNYTGCANFTLPAGVYNFSASATTGETWTGTATSTVGGCQLNELY